MSHTQAPFAVSLEETNVVLGLIFASDFPSEFRGYIQNVPMAAVDGETM